MTWGVKQHTKTALSAKFGPVPSVISCRFPFHGIQFTVLSKNISTYLGQLYLIYQVNALGIFFHFSETLPGARRVPGLEPLAINRLFAGVWHMFLSSALQQQGYYPITFSVLPSIFICYYELVPSQVNLQPTSAECGWIQAGTCSMKMETDRSKITSSKLILYLFRTSEFPINSYPSTPSAQEGCFSKGLLLMTLNNEGCHVEAKLATLGVITTQRRGDEFSRKAY